MKAARIVTLIASVVLFVTGCLHGRGYFKLVEGLSTEHSAPVTANILKTCWLAFSVEMIALAVIALLASRHERGAGIVVVCALANAANGFLLFQFLGLFIGVYLVTLVTVLLLAGGFLQRKAASAQLQA